MSISLTKGGRPPLSDILRRAYARLHFSGILGASMSALAEYYYRLGYGVTGSDIREGDTYLRLTLEGIPISLGNTTVYLEGADALIISHAIRLDSPDILYASAHSIPIYTRSELLGATMMGWGQRVGISGTHGKSTTTAMLDCILRQAGMDPTTFLGARLDGERSYRVGGGDVFLYEACEYRGAFLDFSPSIAVITSIEMDHTDYYVGEEMLRESFYHSTKGASYVIINIDYPLARELLPALTPRVITYGRSKGADYRYIDGDGVDVSFTLYDGGRERPYFLPHLPINYPNAVAAIIVADLLGVPSDAQTEALAVFSSIPMRQEPLGYLGESLLMRDYAHHPTEIHSLIASLRQRYEDITVVFRPHTLSRTRDLWDGFVSALSYGGRVLITDIYPAREERIEGIDAERLAGEIPGAEYIPIERVSTFLVHGEHRGVVLLVGAGDFSLPINNIKPYLIKRKEKHKE